MRKQKGPSRHEWREGEREAVSFPLTSAPHERDSLMSVDTVVTWLAPVGSAPRANMRYNRRHWDRARADIPQKNADFMWGRIR